MSKELGEIEMEMFEERERTGRVDPEAWASRHPEFRDHIVQFAEDLNSEGRVGDMLPSPEIWPDEGGVAMNARWDLLEGLFSDAGHDPDRILAHELKRARTGPRPSPSGFSAEETTEFRRAVVYTWVIDALLRHRGYADRFLTQKITYLLERALELDLFTRHLRMAAGKYDPSARYDDAEPIASDPEQGWIVIVRDPQFLPGPNLADIHKYAPAYIGAVPVADRLVRRLLRLTRDELEVWTTVDDAALDLAGRGVRITVPAVRDAILRLWVKDGPAKLQQPYFSDRWVARALKQLVALGFLDPDVVDLPPS